MPHPLISVKSLYFQHRLVEAALLPKYCSYELTVYSKGMKTVKQQRGRMNMLQGVNKDVTLHVHQCCSLLLAKVTVFALTATADKHPLARHEKPV